MEEFLTDHGPLYWMLTRFCPGYPPLYATFKELPLRVLKETQYLDYAVGVAVKQKAQ